MIISEILPHVIDTAREAGALIMRYYKTGHAVTRKEDASPVTEADHEADQIIVNRLKRITPAIPVVSEEGDKPDVTQSEYFWLVDPIDGTRSFIRGSGYFTVNIGLIFKQRMPVLGVIYDPVHDMMYYGTEKGAFLQHNDITEPIHTRIRPKPMTALISHSHINRMTEEYLVSHNITERIPCASSIKFCLLAEGKGDIYPRFGPTMEWDVAAGHAILSAAGGKITNPDGSPFIYGKPGFENGYFVASN